MRARSVVGLLCFLTVGCGGMADPDVETSSSALKKRPGRDRCAVRAPSAADQAAIESQIAASTAKPTTGVITVPVHFHVVTRSDGLGDVSALIPAQMQVLDAAYASAGFQFQLVSQEVVANDDWFFSAAGSAEEQDMKASLRQGGADDLNIYTTLGDIYLGWATFPKWYQAFGFYDGVVLYYATLPGTGFEFPYDPELEPDGLIVYDEGDTGTHEVGHWLGLYHTFQNGCSASGDLVQDTPPQRTPTRGCPEGKDTCTTDPGLDPIHNFMDYSDDPCYTEFTGGQSSRMTEQFLHFRTG